jgi:hypothetical protein
MCVKTTGVFIPMQEHFPQPLFCGELLELLPESLEQQLSEVSFLWPPPQQPEFSEVTEFTVL